MESWKGNGENGNGETVEGNKEEAEECQGLFDRRKSSRDVRLLQKRLLSKLGECGFFSTK